MARGIEGEERFGDLEAMVLAKVCPGPSPRLMDGLVRSGSSVGEREALTLAMVSMSAQSSACCIGALGGPQAVGSAVACVEDSNVKQSVCCWRMDFVRELWVAF